MIIIPKFTACAMRRLTAEALNIGLETVEKETMEMLIQYFPVKAAFMTTRVERRNFKKEVSS